MEALVSAAQNFSVALDASSSYQEIDQAIKDSLAQLKASNDLRMLVLKQPTQALQKIDSSKQSIISALVLAHALEAFKQIPGNDRSYVLDATVEFLTSFDPIQGRYVGKQLVSILSIVGTQNLFPPLIATELLVVALRRIDPSGSTFTLPHLALARLAYAEGTIEQALPVLRRDITSFPSTGQAKAGLLRCDPEIPPSVYMSQSPAWSSDIRPDSVLEYNFIRGLVYTSRREWSRAQAAFQQTITHPCKEKGVSKISVDAYKRWLLIGLLHHGQEYALPSYTPTSVRSACASLGQAYISIAKLFNTSFASELKAEVEAGVNVWTEDGTLPLVMEVLASYQKWRIINLRQVYSEISVSQLTEDTASAETGEPLKEPSAVAALVQSMIDSGMLKGQLHVAESGTSYLTFEDQQTLLTEQDFSREVARSHHTIQTLAAEYKTVNERLSGNKEYVKHMAREQKRLEKEIDNPTGGFESQIEDEDLMTGVVVNG